MSPHDRMPTGVVKQKNSGIVDDHCLGPANTGENATLRSGGYGGMGERAWGSCRGSSKRARGRDWLLIAASPGSCRSIIRFHRADHWDSFGELWRDGRARQVGVGLLRPGTHCPQAPTMLGYGLGSGPGGLGLGLGPGPSSSHGFVLWVALGLG